MRARAGGRRGCERDAAPVAQEQRLPQLHLEAADLPREGGLRDRQQLCGPGEAARVGDVHEVFELPQIHAVSHAISI